MRRVVPIYRLAACAAVAALFATGCRTSSFEGFDRDLDTAEVRHLYAPMAASPSGLLETLQDSEKVATIFKLTRGGAERYPVPLPDELYWDEDKAVFFHLKSDEATEGPTRWNYFNGRKLRVEALGGSAPTDSDLVWTGEGAFSVYRTIAVTKGGASLSGDLEVYRYDFSLADEGDIEVVDYRRVSRAKGADFQPVILPVSGLVIYVHQEGEQPR